MTAPLHPREGYYKFAPRFAGPWTPPPNLLAEINRWRTPLYRLTLIGAYQDGPLAGIGFGNLSRREPEGFVISATRTGQLPELGETHLTLVTRYDLDTNTVDYLAQGSAVVPSAECMTHGALYHADPTIRAVLHVHNLEFWKRLLNQVPTTRPDVEYGTPEMSREILRLHRESDLRERRLVAMAGHEEGVISFGRDLEEASRILLDAYRGATV